MRYIIEHEGPWALFKGIGPQILKGLLVQGFLMMTKERYVEMLKVCARDANTIPGSSFSLSCYSDTSAKYAPKNCKSLQTSQQKKPERRRRSLPSRPWLAGIFIPSSPVYISCFGLVCAGGWSERCIELDLAFGTDCCWGYTHSTFYKHCCILFTTHKSASQSAYSYAN